MEVASVPYIPRTVEEVYQDFKGRRCGLLKALTADVDEFCQQCDPERENLCLYGFPSGSWEVNLPAEEVPAELPEPALGINFARDGMDRKDWLSLVAVHSDAWLVAVAFYYGARFDMYERERLFNLMNDLPTVFDVVTGRKLVKEKTSTNKGNKVAKASGKAQKSSEAQAKPAKQPPSKYEEPIDEEENEEEHGDTFCGICFKPYTLDEFWIGCDVCEKWYHGKCVKVSAAKAEQMKQYKCPSCSNKRARA